jgi:integrase
VSVKGKREKRDGFPTYEAALAWELEAKAAMLLGKPIPEPTDTKKTAKVYTISDFVDHVYQLHWVGLKAGDGALMLANLFRDWVGPKAAVADAITAEKIAEYVKWRRTEKRNSGATLNRHLSAISTMAKIARAEKKIPERLEMPWQKEHKGRLRFYTEEEVALIDKFLRAECYEHIADLFLFLGETGFRVEEALTLEWRDVRGQKIDLDPSHVKTNMPRTIGQTPLVQEILERLAGVPGGPFRGISKRTLRTVWEKLRGHYDWMGEDTVIHTYRHTCASRMAERDVHPRAMQEWLGHTNPATTNRYTHLRPNYMMDVAAKLGRKLEGVS